MGQQHKIGSHKTNVIVNADEITVQYHDTIVFHYNKATSVITFDTGGFFTATTKTRMNQALNQFSFGGKVFQKDFKWYYMEYGKIIVPFGDNMKIDVVAKQLPKPEEKQQEAS